MRSRALSALPACVFTLLAPTALEVSARGDGPRATRSAPAVSCRTRPGGASDAAVLHRYARALAPPAAAASASARDIDVGDVAILEDRGDLLVRRNPFDLDGTAVRFAPNRAGGYDAVPFPIPLPAAGTRLALDAQGAAAIDLPFAFPFFGLRHRTARVDADGRVAFGVGGPPGDPSLGGFLAGPPAVAAFLADLDPARGGSVSLRASARDVEIVWSDVPGAGQLNRNGFAIVLRDDGTVDLVYSRLETREAVAGVSPGATTEFSVADLSRGTPAGTRGALVERFSENDEIDLVAATRRFYSSHPDDFDQLVLYTTRPSNPVAGTLAFEINVENAVRGIGLDVLDSTATWGSAGALESVVFMDAVDAYLDVDGLEVLAHEVGHRWLARLRYATGPGTTSGALMSGDAVHWSFFHDTGASFLGGNTIAEPGAGRFETVDFARRYGPLDQYAMGLRAPEEVSGIFHVEVADDFRPSRAYKASSPSEAGVSFTGVRRDVGIEEVVAAMGPRLPRASEAPRTWRMAFLLIADPGAPASARRQAAVARIRSAFTPFFEAATDGRMRAESRLRP